MSTLDPFLTSADGPDAPYKNAFAINQAALAVADVELPFASSAIYFSSTTWHVRVLMLGGTEVVIPYVSYGKILPLRVTKILHQEHYDPDDLSGSGVPYGVVALW